MSDNRNSHTGTALGAPPPAACQRAEACASVSLACHGHQQPAHATIFPHVCTHRCTLTSHTCPPIARCGLAARQAVLLQQACRHAQPTQPRASGTAAARGARAPAPPATPAGDRSGRARRRRWARRSRPACSAAVPATGPAAGDRLIKRQRFLGFRVEVRVMSCPACSAAGPATGPAATGQTTQMSASGLYPTSS